MSRVKSTNPHTVQPTAEMHALVNKIAVRAATGSTRLENREVPTGHVRSRGVKTLLEERQAHRH